MLVGVKPMLKNLTSRFSQSLRHFGHNDSGVSAVEFAFVGPPFLIILGCTIETGMMMFTEYMLQSAVNDSARLVRTGQAQTNPLSKDQFKAAICKTASLMIDCTGGVTVYVRSDTNFQNLKNNLPPLVNIGPSVSGSTQAPACYSPGAPTQPAAVVATYDWYFNMWGMSPLGNIGGGAARRLIGFAIFQNEPYPGTSTPSC